MSKLLIALGIVLAAGLAGCESMGGKNPFGETVGTVGGAVGHEAGERYDERHSRR